jgi:hypothetical protein
MTVDDSGRQAVPEAAGNASSVPATIRGVFGRLNPTQIAVLLGGTAGGILMAASDFATLRSVKVLTASCSDLADPSLRGSCVTHGGEEHAYALVLFGVVAVLMAWGASAGRSRPAGAGLAILGAAVLAIALITDVPDIDKTGVLGERFEQAKATAGPGLWMELAGGALAFVAGVMAASIKPPRRRRSREAE